MVACGELSLPVSREGDGSRPAAAGSTRAQARTDKGGEAWLQARTDPTWQQPTVATADTGVPRVRTISLGDLRDVLGRGVADFRAMPRHVIYLGLIYAVVCLLLVGFTFGRDLVPLVFPMVAGFALLGPFAAVGLYELSRRRERGADTSWWHMLAVSAPPRPALS
jgi:uncharacterized membrane protein